MSRANTPATMKIIKMNKAKNNIPIVATSNIYLLITTLHFLHLIGYTKEINNQIRKIVNNNVPSHHKIFVHQAKNPNTIKNNTVINQ